MIALIQRVNQAAIHVENRTVSEIEHGMLALIGIEKTDTWANAEKLANKLLSYRLFADHEDKMNLNIVQSGGELLLVSQFTLAANTQKGNRPGFDPAMPPQEAEAFFARFCAHTQSLYEHVSTGEFGANMQVSLVNDGPVTFWLQT
ncbi:D-aminoacyl-tRNA deacylase [Suttonella sp. R2A3]|uniref:D-aminoacyl-tRNA deacylase n=1 Tax=Suttonella sp. R2A3 TaxID=2908648 RepID=UPI001F1E9817|nr:D-aminoacyl-tRNA deacylase [Suttonella sp. R2A3]UJF23694.1 D-aminoacyl-tRNA deacylase [Suttonella sp. R2A3]